VSAEQGLDVIARLIAEYKGAGRVIGARPGGGGSCDVELLMLSRVNNGGRYRLRSAVVSLDGLRAVRARGFDPAPPASVAVEDVLFLTLTEAMNCAGTMIRSSPSRPIPGEGSWQPREAFLEGLTRPRLRSQISWLPQPPLWWNITRFVLAVIGGVAVFLLPFVPAFVLTEYFGWDDGPPAALAFLLPVALFLVLFVILRERSAEGADMIERRLERRLAESSPDEAPTTSLRRPCTRSGRLPLKRRTSDPIACKMNRVS
jgi:hypothetical protein